MIRVKIRSFGEATAKVLRFDNSNKTTTTTTTTTIPGIDSNTADNESAFNSLLRRIIHKLGVVEEFDTSSTHDSLNLSQIYQLRLGNGNGNDCSGSGDSNIGSDTILEDIDDIEHGDELILMRINYNLDADTSHQNHDCVQQLKIENNVEVAIKQSNKSIATVATTTATTAATATSHVTKKKSTNSLDSKPAAQSFRSNSQSLLSSSSSAAAAAAAAPPSNENHQVSNKRKAAATTEEGNKVTRKEVKRKIISIDDDDDDDDVNNEVISISSDDDEDTEEENRMLEDKNDRKKSILTSSKSQKNGSRNMDQAEDENIDDCEDNDHNELVVYSDRDSQYVVVAATTSTTTASVDTLNSVAIATTRIKKGRGRRKRTTKSFISADKENASIKKCRNTNVDDDTNDEKKPPAKKKNLKLNRNNNNNNNSSNEEDDHDDDDAVVAVPAPSSAFVPTVASAVAASSSSASTMPRSNGNEDDEEIELVGHTGNNALSDFPHSRENCVQYFFQSDPKKFCPNCYCFVCDIPAAECSSWQQHCVAMYSSPRWKAERERKKNGGSSQPQHQQQPQNRSTNSWSSSSLNYHQRSKELLIEEILPVKTLLDAVTRVYPSERSPPTSSGFVTTLRHYQKQSLSFMIDTEESQEGWANHVYRHAYVQDQSTTVEESHIRGGWLCSEVGMGKTAVVIALVASKPALQLLSSLPTLDGRTRLKATVVMTSVSLMGQWEDECRKHAPALKVVRFHPSAKKTSRDAINTADIIITSATYIPERWLRCGVDISRVMFHRVVMDESHLFYSKPGSASSQKARAVPAMNRWCCTATPMTSTAVELNSQGDFLHIQGDERCRLWRDREFLKKHMIRHVKAQKINGIKALALPKSTSSVKMVPMTPDEQSAYANAVKENLPNLEKMKLRSAKFFNVKNQIVYTLTKPLLKARSSKIVALENAIIHLMRNDPNVRVVVFTQMRNQLLHVQTMVNSLSARTRGGVCLYSFDGSSPHKKRDESIRQFQSTAGQGPAVFCITLNTGSVGITLTAASHVFLLEPSVDPADEIQAAGRINRLGQTKQVGVTKLVYKDTYESNVITLHEKIASGDITFDNKSIPKAAVCILLKDV